jgi:hypothetical protein
VCLISQRLGVEIRVGVVGAGLTRWKVLELGARCSGRRVKRTISNVRWVVRTVVRVRVKLQCHG